MKTAFIIFNKMTALDFVGVYDPLTRLRSMGFMPDFQWEICSISADVSDGNGLKFVPTVVSQPLDSYDWVVVPGGLGTRVLMADATFLSWLKTAADCEVKASVCSGSLLLGAAGFLANKRATTHPKCYLQLAQYCQTVVPERIVDEGEVVTAGGVTAAIDLGLHLVKRLAGEKVKESIREQMDYYQPRGHRPGIS